MVSDFNDTFEVWESALQKYDFEKLLIKPAAGSWSLGQVYRHLIEETNWYLEQVEGCFDHQENALEEINEEGRAIFLSNALPDRIIKGDPFIAEKIKNPASKTGLRKDFHQLKLRANLIWDKIVITDTHGKTLHPGLGYFSPKEWFQYAEMHMRHHLKQKRRIEGYLERSNIF